MTFRYETFTLFSRFFYFVQYLFINVEIKQKGYF